MSQIIAPALEPMISDSAESIGLELRDALHTVRMQSLSLHDARGDVLWLSEGALGPDEHGAVLESMANHTLKPGDSVVERPLGDGRNALLPPACTDAGDVVGVAMLIQDAKCASPTLRTKLSDPRLQTALAKLAARQQSLTASNAALTLELPEIPADGIYGADGRADALSSDDDYVSFTPLPSQVAPLAGAKPDAEARPAVSGASPQGNAPEPMPPSPASTAAPDARLRMESASNPQAADAIASASELRDLTLVVQRLIPLRPRAETRRYEVLLRSRQQPTRKTLPNVLLQAMTASDSACAIDRYVLTKLVSWLGQHRSAWQSDAISFSIGVAHSTLADESFLPWAATLFEQWVVPPAVVGFEIAQRACIEAPGQIRAFIDTCESTGFFFILEDFSMHSAAVPFLASPALRLIKMDSRLTSSAMTSKLPEALVIAMSQAAKVLDVRYAAKHIDSRITAKWLAARGIDCAQGHALEQLGSIDSLLVATGAARPAESAVR